MLPVFRNGCVAISALPSLAFVAWVLLDVIVLSAFAGFFWFPVDVAASYQVFIFGLFLVAGGIGIASIYNLSRIKDRQERRSEQLALVNRELRHRMKNLFAVALSICLQTIRSAQDREHMLKSITGRLCAVAAALDLLGTSPSKDFDLHSLIGGVVGPVAPEASRLQADGQQMLLAADLEVTFALILHELATNALKYGAWCSDHGTVTLFWRVEEGRHGRWLNFNWREEGGPLVASPVHEGLGSALIKSSLSSALVIHDLKPDGLDCRIKLPLAN